VFFAALRGDVAHDVPVEIALSVVNAHDEDVFAGIEVKIGDAHFATDRPSCMPRSRLPLSEEMVLMCSPSLR